MTKFLSLYMVVALLCVGRLHAEWRLSVTGGVSAYNCKEPTFNMASALEALAKEIRGVVANLDLEDGTHFWASTPKWRMKADVAGLYACGLYFKDAPSAPIEGKVNDAMFKLHTKVVKLFPPEEFALGKFPTFKVNKNSRDIIPDPDAPERWYCYSCFNLEPLFMKSLKYPEFHDVRILNGSRNEITLSPEDFDGPESLKSALFYKIISPDYATICDTWNKLTSPKAVHKAGLTLGLSLAYSHSFFAKDSSKFGFYCGVEGFAEITPHAVKTSSFFVREREFGLRPFFGVESRDSWRVFALVGVKCSRKNISSPLLGLWRNSPGYKSDQVRGQCSRIAFELGLGSEFLISDKFSVGFKVIKTLKSSQKIRKLKINTSSVKFLLSFSYRF